VTGDRDGGAAAIIAAAVTALEVVIVAVKTNRSIIFMETVS
jgi:hypothetical protein